MSVSLADLEPRGRRVAERAAALLTSCLVAVSGATFAASEVGGASDPPLVESVTLSSDSSVSHGQDLRELVDIEVGAPLSREQIRGTLRNMQASGVVGEAEVWLSRGARGVDLQVAIYPKLLVRSIAIEGELCVRESMLKNRLQQVEGTPLSESRLVRGVYQMQDVLLDEGFELAAVSLRVEVDEAARQAAVGYLVECGEPTLIERVEFTGDLGPFSSESLAQRLRQTEGKRLQRSRLRTDDSRLQEWLIGSGFKQARVAAPREEPGSSPHRTILTYEVETGPRFELRVTGADKKFLERKKLLQLLEHERFDEAILDQVLRGIERFYQSRGHYDVEVEWKTEPKGDVLECEIQISPGPVYSVEAVRFRGNETVRHEDLVARMRTRPGRVLGGGSRLVDGELEDDLANLRAHYARQGFAGAKVGPPEVHREPKSLAIEIPIVEGPRTWLVALDFVGLEAPEVRASVGDLPLSPGGPFHPRLLEEALDELRARYEEAGYLSAQVTAEVTSGADPHLKTAEIRVLEGPRVELGRVIVRGNARTHGAVIRRGLGLVPGERINRRSLLDAQRRLYRLGIFSQAEVRWAPAIPFAAKRDVIVRVREGRRRRVTFGIGYDSEDGLRTLLGFTQSNLHGRAVSARLDLRISEREEQFRVLIRQPFLGGWSVPVTYSLFAIEEDQESFDSKRRGLQVEAHRQWDANRFGLLYTYKIVEVLEKPGVPIFTLGIDRNLQEAEIASLTPSVLLDYRDDPLVPTRGWTFNAQTEVAFPLASASAEFAKLFGQGSLYVPLGRLGVVAGSVRLGAIEPLTSIGGDPGRLIPISEEFFAGGRTSHRAYRRDLLGVLGETVLLCSREEDTCVGQLPPGETIDTYRRIPVGGNGLLLLNLDYRFPIAGALGGTLFADAGNVWTEWEEVDLGEIKLGAGVGLRYLSPIGPLRLEIGWKFDREEGEGSSVVFLSFGNPF